MSELSPRHLTLYRKIILNLTLSRNRHIFVTRAPQLSGRTHIFVTPVVAVSLLQFSTCAFVCPRISCFFFYPGLFVMHFNAPISMACRDTVPSDTSFLFEYLGIGATSV